MAALLDLVRVTSTTTGTGTLTLGSAVQGFLTETQAGAADGQIYSYAIEGSYVAAGDEFVASARETGIGAYTASGRTLTRTVQFSTNSNALLNLTGDQQVIIATLTSSQREKLTANRTYFVRTDGSDSNNGLVNSAGGAFLTIQKAINVAQVLDFNLFDVLISVGSGTFTGTVRFNTVPPGAAGSLAIQGAGMASTTISVTSNDAIRVENGARVSLSDLKITTTTSGVGLLVGQGSRANISAVDFGACVTDGHIRIDGGIVSAESYTISGNAPAHLCMEFGSLGRYTCSDATITVTGTPAFSNETVKVTNGSQCFFDGVTFSGSATGKRFEVENGGVINTGGGGANFIPGDSAGTGTNFGASPWGLYI